MAAEYAPVALYAVARADVDENEGALRQTLHPAEW
jgi:hypothetical protein